jgi:opacity protein-like surface antigen
METNRSFHSHLRRALGGLALLAALAGAETGSAAEIIPSVGLSRMTGGDGEAKLFGGLALRGHLAPVLISEIGVAYRSEDRLADRLKVRMWPVTASLYVAPIPTLYAGAGVGWYHLSLDYDDALPLRDRTSQEFGVHVGGGMQVPLAPSAALDLNGRYVFLQEQESALIPESFDPDFWSTTLGLALKF